MKHPDIPDLRFHDHKTIRKYLRSSSRFGNEPVGKMSLTYGEEQDMSEEKIAVVFPGQGSQRAGMGKDFYDGSPIAGSTYEEASDVLGWDVPAMCFMENEKLHLTEYAQPCILATEIAMYRTIQQEFQIEHSFYGGHSLGEYAALVAADVLSYQDALKIVHERGKLMQKASPLGTGSMAAVIGENIPIHAVRKALNDLPIDIANINSLHQIVISGRADSMDTAAGRIRESVSSPDAIRFVLLQVSAPFHSRFMRGITALFRDVLNRFVDGIHPERAVRVASNFTGSFHGGSSMDILNNLLEQLSNTVKWHDNMSLLSQKASRIYEIGPNRPLRKFFQSIGATCSSITTFSGAMREFQNRKSDDTI
jgi:[acyl-carrier-protein] S-malonyltransferase/trans-AT polyketide synthase/acyltransferase/oxidoreductase domain-containing protein